MLESNTLRFLVALCLVAAVGCKKEEGGEGETADKPAEGETAAKAGEEKPADKPAEPAGPKVFKYDSAKAFWDEYTPLDGKGVMDKYGMDGKIEIKGAVTKKITEMDESVKLHLGVSEKEWVSLSFTDKQAAKDIEKEAEVTAMCSIGGRTNTFIMLIDCELK